MVGRVDTEFSDSPSSLHLKNKMMFSQDQFKAMMERQKSYYRRQ